MSTLKMPQSNNAQHLFLDCSYACSIWNLIEWFFQVYLLLIGFALDLVSKCMNFSLSPQIRSLLVAALLAVCQPFGMLGTIVGLIIVFCISLRHGFLFWGLSLMLTSFMVGVWIILFWICLFWNLWVWRGSLLMRLRLSMLFGMPHTLDEFKLT